MFTAIEASVIRFKSVSKKGGYSQCIAGSLSGGTVFFAFVARCLGILHLQRDKIGGSSFCNRIYS